MSSSFIVPISSFLMASNWRQLGIGTNWPVLVAVGVLSAMGVLCIWATKPDEATKQIAFLGIAIVCMSLFQAIDYRTIGRFSWGFYIVSLLSLVYTVVPFTHVPSGDLRPLRVPETHGAFAWINFGPLRFQPAELVKIAFIMVMARYLRFRSNYRTVTGLLQPFALAMVPLALILLQPDLGTALIFIPALFVMLFVAGAKIRHLMAVVGLGLVMGPFLWLCGSADNGAPGLPLLKHMPTFVKRYQRDRVYAMFIENQTTLRSTGMQQHRALTAMGSGGIEGRGMGDIRVSKHVPEANNDMIFAVVGEQFGLFGSAAVLLSYIVLFAAGIEIASATREPFGKLLAIGVVALLAGQAFLNLMVVTKLMPVTGVTLPFMSYGGSSLLASYLAAGLLINIGQNRPLVMANNSFEFE